ncbi:hypothetical protein [Serratia proteamaculans]
MKRIDDKPKEIVMYAQKRKETSIEMKNDVTDTRNDEANICNLLTAQQGYIYIPFAAPDLVDQSLGLNLHRHLKGKALYPLIGSNQNVLVEMEKLRAAEVIKLTTQINEVSDQLQKVDISLKSEADWNSETLRNKISHETFDSFVISVAKLSQQLSVLKNMQFSRKSLSQLSPERDKLYVLGHGGAGIDLLAADEEMTLGHMSAKTLVKQMEKGGLPKTFKDIRITACYSADSMKPTSFSSEELDETSGALRQKTGILRELFNPPTDITPLAKSISRELNRLGYKSTRVTGYHGAGVTFSQSDYRTRRIEGVLDIRRSLVKRIF